MRLISTDIRSHFNKSKHAHAAVVKTSHMGASLKTFASSSYGADAGFGSNTLYTQPMFFSPLHTPQNWQIPSKKKEINQWCRYYVENEPKVAAAIDFYCFEPSMQVLMADGGQKSISSIEIGDLVRSHDGTVNQVVNKFEKITNEEMLKIKISGVSIGPLRVTKGHDLLTDRDGKIDFIQAGELKKGDYLLTPIKYEGTDSVNNDFAWLLGVYSAEGCAIPYEHKDKKGNTNEYHKGVYFTLAYEEKDTLAKEILEKIEKIYGKNKVTIRSCQEEGITRISAYGRGIADDLCGLCPGIARVNGSKRFSPTVLRWKNENLLHLLAGFFSGDGCFNNKNGFQGVGVAKKLAEQIANICDRIGVEYSFTSTRLDHINRQTCYNVRISRRACGIFENLSYKVNNGNFDDLNAKNTPYFVKGNYIYRKITRIDNYDYIGKVYDLEIENSHSYVVNRISVHNSNFPMNGFENECPNIKVKRYFDNMCKRLNLDYWTRMISYEYYLMGDVFPFTEFKCDHCGGTGIDPKTPDIKCRHAGGTINRLIVLNPDWIDVQWNILADSPLITLTPDDELRRIVLNKSPKAIYDKMPVNIRSLVMTGQPIPLSNRAVSQLKHNASPYSVYGTSLIRRLFKTLAYKDKLMTAQWIVAERLILPIRIVKVGTDERPAGPEDIANVQAQLGAVANDPNLTLVTHHGLEYTWEGASGKTIQISNEMEIINQEILDGVMLNQALLNGEMAGYGGLAIGVETMIQRMESWRLILKRWIEERMYKMTAMMQGFIDEEASKELGEVVYMYPKIRWNDLNMRDKNQEMQIFMQLHEKQVVSAETLCEKANIDYDQEVERIRYEQATMSAMTGGPPGAPGGIGGGFGGAALGGGMPPLGGEAGGLPPLGGAPGEAPGGMPPMGGSPEAGGAPPMDMGGAPPPPGPMASVPSEKRIMKPEKRKKIERLSKQEKEGVVENRIIQFTSIEKKMYKGLIQSKIPYKKFAQYEMPPYTLDFALPDLRIDIECDGETFHSAPAQVERDNRRDAELSKLGWTVLRFKDKEIDDYFPAVINKVVDTINKKAQYYRDTMLRQKKNS